jgi:hypothetical protein
MIDFERFDEMLQLSKGLGVLDPELEAEFKTYDGSKLMPMAGLAQATAGEEEK